MTELTKRIEAMEGALIRLRSAERLWGEDKLPKELLDKLIEADRYISSIKNTASDLVYAKVLPDRR